MDKVKLIQGLDAKDLQEQINSFLATLKDDALKDLNIDMQKMNAIILYKVVEEWQGMICADCKYWDDEGDTSAVSGLCFECGQRRRFNSKACKCFKDIRRQEK